MNSRGFNLFTAIVSFLLITLAVLLVQSMIQSERRAVDTLRAMESRADIEAVADNAAADAVQLFNYKLRLKLARYIAQSSGGTNNYFSLDLQEKKWDEIVDSFVSSRFGGDIDPVTDIPRNQQFATEVAGAMREFFYSTPSFGRYSIDIETPSSDPTVLDEMINKLVSRTIATGNFFEVVECSGNAFDCELGTFYVTLAVNELTAEEYEKLPRVIVTNKATGEEIKQVILPKTNFKIYVPLRIFKAIAEARGLAHFESGGTSSIDDLIDGTGNDGGVLAKGPGSKNETIDKMGLGLCDASSCAPRTDPENAPSNSSLLGAACPGDPEYTKAIVTNLSGGNCPQCVPPNQYNANYDGTQYLGSTATKSSTALENVLNNKICEWAGEAYSSEYFGFDFQRNNNDFNLLGGSCSLENDLVESVNAVPEQIEAKLLSSVPSSYGQQYAYCTDVREWSAILAFEENNENYLIEKDSAGEWIKLVYRIQLYDNRFSPVTGSSGGLGSCDSDRSYNNWGAPEIENCRP